MCARGCSTTAWLRAKPEWARGARLVRFTPRFNADVNGYWMCDIGRFGFHWIESDSRLTTPLVRQPEGTLAASTWTGALTRVRDQVMPVVKEDPAAFRLLVSAHASHEELFLAREIAARLQGLDRETSITVAWRSSQKAQPPRTTFTVPRVDAPNVAGARAFGFRVPGGADDPCDMSALRADVEAGSVTALYVIDPGPEGSIGDVRWVSDARKAGTLPLLIVQGVLMTPLAAAADIVLPGAAWIEKDATFTNSGGLLQATAKAIDAPGDAREDWLVLTQVAAALGITLDYRDAAAVRAAIAAESGSLQALCGIESAPFSRPVAARTWLQTSNPSERWKWDHVFQDLPPVKGFPALTREGK
jgi:predicted molibdopterin-dependent oxidoreductase YjgC